LIDVRIALKDVTKQSRKTKTTKNTTSRNLRECDNFKIRSPFISRFIIDKNTINVNHQGSGVSRETFHLSVFYRGGSFKTSVLKLVPYTGQTHQCGA
jgi:23S rRNA-/tRNA-specific pseudouridylate synthase